MAEESTRHPPSLFSQAAHFAASLSTHIQDGMRKCTQDEILARLEICKACPSFQNDRCVECNCNCKVDTVFFNKLAWRSEKCPLNKWARMSEPSLDVVRKAQGVRPLEGAGVKMNCSPCGQAANRIPITE